MKIKKEDRILFFGDSVTESGRNHDNKEDLGHGFPLLLASEWLAQNPDFNLHFFNRGIGGNKVNDLLKRVQNDCIDLHPNLVLILIGINDVWSAENDADFGTAKNQIDFKNTYRLLLEKIKESGIERIVLLDPFVLPYPKERNNWRNDLDKKIQIIRELAGVHHCELIPLDGYLNALAIQNLPQYYTGEDGVHPTYAGHGAIAACIKNYVTV